jgi:hypothetical protein
MSCKNFPSVLRQQRFPLLQLAQTESQQPTRYSLRIVYNLLVLIPQPKVPENTKTLYIPHQHGRICPEDMSIYTICGVRLQHVPQFN